MDQHGSTVNDPRISWPGPQDRQKKNSSNSSSSRQKFKAILSPNQKEKQTKKWLTERGASTYTHGMAIGLIVPLMIIAKPKPKLKPKPRQGKATKRKS